MQYSYMAPEKTKLVIPAGKMHEAFIELQGRWHGMPRCVDEKDTVIALLGEMGFEALDQPNGDIHIVNYIGENDIDAHTDPVLQSLQGITPAGSFITYWDINGMWKQARYDEASFYVAHAEISFSEDKDHDYPLTV